MVEMTHGTKHQQTMRNGYGDSNEVLGSLRPKKASILHNWEDYHRNGSVEE
jgi:hypothetical protein